MSRSKQVRVSRVADWAGWCTPCESEDRPLVLTRTGAAGVGAWLAGIGDDDRFLLLTCNVCGHWQVVPPREEDDPEVVLDEDDAVRASVLEVVAEVRAAVSAPPGQLDPVQVPVAGLPAAAGVDAGAGAAASSADLAAAAGGILDLSEVDPLVDAEPVPAPACAVPAPRRKTVVLPDAAPAISAEAVAAAARVLAAARVPTQRTAPRSAAARPAPLDRSRRTRKTASTRRTERPAPARAPRAAAPAVATSIVLPAVTLSQLVLATG